MNDFLVPFLLLQHLLPLFLEQLVLFLTHLRVSQDLVIQIVIATERTLQNEAVMVSEDASTLHASLLPITFIDVPVLPLHLASIVVGPILESPLVHVLFLYCQLSLPLFLIPIPKPLH